jgi:hypothetical protein
MCLLFPAFLGSHSDLCLFWQGRESSDTQSKPLNLLSVWDWSVQFEPKAQTLLRNPLYVEKPKLDKGPRKGMRFKVRCSCLNHLRLPHFPHVYKGKSYIWILKDCVKSCHLWWASCWDALGESFTFSKSALPWEDTAVYLSVSEDAVAVVTLCGVRPLNLPLCVVSIIKGTLVCGIYSADASSCVT